MVDVDVRPPEEREWAPSAYPDPVAEIARETFRVPSLYPYQRLVVANILDAAVASPLDAASEYPLRETSTLLDGLEIPPRDQTALAPEALRATDRPSPIGDSRSRQLVILPTGAGKSMCFQLPAALLPGLTVVVYPLLSLIADQKRRLDEVGIGSSVLRGGQSTTERREVFEAAAQGSCRIILTNPETLGTEAVIRRLSEIDVSHLVIDEAHCVCEWGETFRPSYLELRRCIDGINPAVVTAFTATASDTILSGIQNHLFAEGCHLIQGNPDRSNIAYHVVPVLSTSHALVSLLQEEADEEAAARERKARPAPHSPPGGVFAASDLCEGIPHLPAWEYGRPVRRPAIVFCRSRTGTELTSALLRRRLGDERVYFYHAGLTKEEKAAREQWFYDSKDGILVATCAYGMGVDKKNIRSVIHLDTPPSVESYLQESGRGGRDGNPADAIMLVPSRSRSRGAPSSDALSGDAGPIGAARHAQVLDYAASDCCRRETLLKLLGWESPEACFGCDVCFGSRQDAPPEQEACAELIRRNRRRFTGDELGRLLRGAYYEADWIPRRNSPLGGWTREDTEEALSALISSGTIRVHRRGPWKGRIDLRIARRVL